MIERLRESTLGASCGKHQAKEKISKLCMISLSRPDAVEYKALYHKYLYKTTDYSPKCAKIE